jgi:thiol-disulfide isomerase/thioredoxin
MRITIPIATCLLLMTTIAVLESQAATGDVPTDRIVVMYFHRTERCPTCKKMGAYAEEAVKQAFADELKKGTVEFRFVDFENKKNARLVKGYKVEDPALVISKIVANKVKEFKHLEDIWTKVQEKPEYVDYVQKNVAAYQK